MAVWVGAYDEYADAYPEWGQFDMEGFAKALHIRLGPGFVRHVRNALYRAHRSDKILVDSQRQSRKISFENNPHEQLCGWARQLHIFRICRSPGGHQDQVPDAFSARATFHDERSRTEFLGSLGIVFDRNHPVIFRGHKIRLHLASRNGWHDIWHDIWFNVTSGNSCTDPLTEEDFRIAKELDMFFQNLAVKFIDPWDNDNCITPKFYPEVF